MSRRLTTDEWVARAKEKFGDRYDYRLARYKTNQTPVQIVCRKHNHKFEQRPASHLQGQLGCSACQDESPHAHRKYTKADFVRKAREKFGRKYDYSLVDYRGSQEEVTFICRKHGQEFQQKPASHLTGRAGCSECRRDKPGGGPLITTEEFIRRARQAHGDAFDYSEVEYTGRMDNVRVYCKRHQKFFEVAPKLHITRYKQGCNECRRDNNRKLRGLGLEKWIKRAQAKHEDRFDYSQAVYLSQNEPMEVICRKHAAHGPFLVTPYQHPRLKDGGCPYCGPVLNTELMLARCKEIHPDHYDFSKAKFNGYDGRVTVRCTKHNYTFKHTAVDLIQGKGCRHCGAERTKAALLSNTEEFIARSRKIHRDFYSYDRTEYTGVFEPVQVGCPIHGYFPVRPADHLKGRGCPTCGMVSRTVRFGKAKWQDHPEVAGLEGLLYYLRIVTPDDRVLFKIGVTKSTVDIRYREYRGKVRPLGIEILAAWRCTMAAAVSIERQILKAHKASRAKGEKILLGGNTELFVEDALGLTGPDAPKMKRRIRRALRASENKWAEVLGWTEPGPTASARSR